jgi:hypothetical protein
MSSSSASGGVPGGNPGAQGQPGQGQPPTPQEIVDITTTSNENIDLLTNFGQSFQTIIANTNQINAFLTDMFTDITMLIGRLQTINDADDFNATIISLYSLLDRYNKAVTQANISNNNDILVAQIDGINQLLQSHIFVYIMGNATNQNQRLFSGDYASRGNPPVYTNVAGVTISRTNETEYVFNANGTIINAVRDPNNPPSLFTFSYNGQQVTAKIIQFTPIPPPIAPTSSSSSSSGSGTTRGPISSKIFGNTSTFGSNPGGGAKRRRRRTRKNKRKSKAKKQKGGFGYNNKVPSSSKKKTSKRRTSTRTSSTTSTSSSK